MTLKNSGLTIGVLGLGHVGLPTALCFAELGWQVIGADDAQGKARLIAKGQSTFYEPGMDELLHKHLASGLFRVATDVPSAVQQADVLFICVGTPQQANGAADLAQIEAVARTVAGNLNSFKLVVEKSTSPVQTAEQIKRAILRYSQDSRSKGHGVEAVGEPLFEVAVNPEFLREGTAIQDFFAPDRIVVGVESSRARELMTRVYQPLLDRLQGQSKNGEAGAPSRLLVTDLNTAEIIKHASNAFLSTKISFINMVADLCDATGADIAEVQRGLQMDQRIGRHFLQAGVGFGGYCLPKDLRALVHIGESYGVDMSLLKGVESINLSRVGRLVNRLKQALWVLDGKRIARTWPFGGWRSSRKPTMCGKRRASKSSGASLNIGATCACSTPRRTPNSRWNISPMRPAWCTARPPKRPPRVPTPSCCSPIGPRSAWLTSSSSAAQ